MKKIALTSILILILATSLIKNSTKEIEDKIFTINENVRSLKAEFSDVMLEYNYLSSPEKLIQHQYQYGDKFCNFYQVHSAFGQNYVYSTLPSQPQQSLLYPSQ